MTVYGALKISRRPAAAYAIVGLFWGSFAALIPVLKVQIGADDALFGLLLLATGAGLVGAMWLAPVIDRRLGPRALQTVAFLFAASFVLPSLAGGATSLALSLLLVGLVSGLTDVIMNARISDLEAATRRPLMNANHGIFSLAYAVSALATGLARQVGLTPPVIFGAAMLVAVGLASIVRKTSQADAPAQAGAEGFSYWPIILCGGVTLIAFMSEATVESWSALHIERTLSGGATQGALGPATLGITMAVGRFGGQAMSARISEYRLIRWATLLSAAGVVIAAQAPVPVVAYAGFGILGLGVSVIGPFSLAIVGRLVPADRRTVAISRVAVIGFSGFFVAPLLMGLISQSFGLRVAFTSVAALLVFIFPLVAMIRRIKPSLR